MDSFAKKRRGRLIMLVLVGTPGLCFLIAGTATTNIPPQHSVA
jgi:hypothetical protein